MILLIKKWGNMSNNYQIKSKKPYDYINNIMIKQ